MAAPPGSAHERARSRAVPIVRDVARRSIAASLLAGLVVLCVAAAVSQPARGAARSVVVVSHTASALPGSRVTVVVAIHGTAKKCLGVLHVGTRSTAAAALVRAKRATLRWTLAQSARSGRATVTITCKPSGRATTALVVRAKTPVVVPAVVAVGKLGFSIATTDVDREMNYGVILRETSGASDALQVQVTANFVDASGKIVDTEVNTIDRIPAGTTFYYGGFGSTALENAAPASLQVTAIVEESQKATGVGLPSVTNLRSFVNIVGETEVQGQLSNPYTQTLTDLTEITYVLFDGAGTVISGGVTSTGADIPPGGQFGFDDTDTTVDSSQASAVSASVDPALASP
jgi:hypothetical protein